MSTDGHVELPTKGFSAVDNPGLGFWLLIVDTENANTLTLVLGTAIDPPQAIPLTLADQVETPAALAANADDYDFAGFTDSTVCRISASAPVDITGFEAGAITGLTLRKKLINVGANAITLKHLVTSGVANQIQIPGGADLPMAPDDAVDIFYDLATTKWRVV
jgi:hypothetical protein